MKKINRDDKAQMLVLEAVLFAVMVFTALFFIFQLSPSPAIDADLSSDQLKILGDDALRTIDKTTPETPGSYYNSKLVKFVANNEKGNFTGLLNLVLPDYVGYNIHLSDGVNATIWYNGEEVSGEKVGLVTRSHRIIVVTNNIVGKEAYASNPIDNRIDELYLPVIDVILEMWYL